MPRTSVYLAKFSSGPSKRSHFGIFFPNPDCDRTDLSNDFRSHATVGSQIHVVGEPLMAGYMLEMKRHFDIQNDRELRALVRLGSIDTTNLHRDDSLDTMTRDHVPKSIVERLADSVPPPPRGQDVRAPIDGVITKRCQEWTMEFLTLLTQKGLISPEAVRIAQGERDSPTHGIFGYKS
ncbi:hypothetical protein LB507_001263 [Fusarium sp. FIESC RH6]|nr:hypothetical protein LB507_001263 [Fusarium sp. FIESC RH6]